MSATSALFSTSVHEDGDFLPTVKSESDKMHAFSDLISPATPHASSIGESACNSAVNRSPSRAPRFEREASPGPIDRRSLAWASTASHPVSHDLNQSLDSSNASSDQTIELLLRGEEDPSLEAYV